MHIQYFRVLKIKFTNNSLRTYVIQSLAITKLIKVPRSYLKFSGTLRATKTTLDFTMI